MIEDLKHRVTSIVEPKPKYHWWQAAAFGLGANAIYRLLTVGRSEERAYENRVQAPFAPPSWVFGPAWGINNVSVLWGNLDLMNEPEDASERNILILLQALWWGFYATFGYVWLRKQSPILALIWTATSWGLTTATIGLSLKTGRSKLVASQLTSFAWLTLATAVAAYQARANPDPLFGYRPDSRPE